MDGLELAGAVSGKLGDHFEWTSGINNHTKPVIVTITNIGGIEVATRLVTYSRLATFCTLTSVEAGYIACMGREMGGSGVSLPDVELIAACSRPLDVCLSCVIILLDAHASLT